MANLYHRVVIVGGGSAGIATAASMLNRRPGLDIAIEAGSEADGTRATYGVSPGDDDHPEPYAYVSPWTSPESTGPSTFWNATGFTGAERPVADADDDGEIPAFFRAARELLTPSTS